MWLRPERLVLASLLACFLLSGPPFGVIAQAQIPSSPKAATSTRNKAATQPAPPPPSSPPAPAELGIPLPQIADQGEQLDQLLRQISKQLTPAAELQESLRTAEGQGEEIRQRALQVDGLLASTPTILEVADEERYWRSRSEQYGSQRKLLTARAAELEQQAGVLDEQLAKWQATWDQIHGAKGIEAVVDRTRQELDEIRVTRSRIQDQLNLVLTLQNRISQEDRQISDVLAKLDQAEQRLRGRVLERDSHPLWEARELRKFDQPLRAVIRQSAGQEFDNAEDFLRANTGRLVGIVLLYLLGLAGAFRLGRYVSRQTRPGVPSGASKVLARPFSVAVLVALLGTIGFAIRAPMPVAFVIYLLYVIPAVRLLPLLIEPVGRIPLYTLAGFYALVGTLVVIQFPPALGRELFALIILAALVIFGWLVRPSRLRQLRMRGPSLLVLTASVRLGLVLLAVSLVANIFGFLALSQILGVATLLGAFVGAALYTAFSVLTLIITTVLRSDRARSLSEMHVEAVERWSKRVLAWGAVLLGLRTAAQLFGIFDAVVSGVHSVLQYPIGFERVHITLGGILSFILILLVGYALANSLALALQNFVFSRLPLQRGLPYAISKVIYYILLILVFVAALTDAGVELNKFTVVTGAVGVGVGFGLQNIVNNFASGLILLFERPIRVGDIVEVGGLAGTIKRIGARSSTVETFQEAEVIVPNSTLVSNQVINWTLSSSRRRAEIPVGVAYGTDPEQVLKLLVEVAESNPGVLRYPKPSAFFLGFGDSALNFELRFWAGQETWFQLKSDVTTSLARALRDAAIEIPFPQRDLHVRSIDGSVKEALAALPDRSVVD